MIDYSEKTIKQGLKSSVWYNELKSVICEDLMQEKLGISEEKSLRNRRTKDFVENYYQVGLTEWGNSTTSYANAFCFGAFLSRNFNDVNHSLVKEMGRNNSIDKDSVTNALKACGHPKETFDTVFTSFTQLLLVNEIQDKNVLTINKKHGNLPYISLKGNIKFFSPKKEGTQTLQPHGFTMHKSGSYSSKGNRELFFEGNPSKDEKLLIVVIP